MQTCILRRTSAGLLRRCTTVGGRRRPPPPQGEEQLPQQQQRRSVSTLILLRHGESIWNGPTARFTGWCDVPLTVRGRVEAVAAGQLMRSRGFKASRVCIAFASELQRSHETCELALASMAGHEQNTWCSDRIRRDWRLNERHYGAVQGRFKEGCRACTGIWRGHDSTLATIIGRSASTHE